LIRAVLATGLLALAPAGSASAEALARIQVVPPRVVLEGREGRQRLVVDGVRRDGSVLDATGSARFAVTDPRVARVDARGLVTACRDGEAWIAVRVGGVSGRIPVTVRGTLRPVRWSFTRHVEPILARFGCSSGPCHGSGSGKGGFRLSLRGYDPVLDWIRIRTEGRGRRIAPARPEQSLLLRKPSLAVPHAGGLRLRRDSLEYRILTEWLGAGAPGPSPQDPRVAALRVHPGDRLLRAGERQQLQVRAIYTDGSSEDVTHWAKYASNEEPIARVDEHGRVQMRRPGETAVTAWYAGKVAFARLGVPFAEGRTARQAPTTASGFIDRLVDRQLRRLGLVPSPQCTDAEFVRRAHLDVIGTLPTVEEMRPFLADRRPGRRERLVDTLLARPEFVDFWASRWSDLFRVNRDLLGEKGMWRLSAWVREQVARNTPWDEMARKLILAGGTTDSCGPANFYRMGARPEEFGETVSQVFLGIRVQCAKCHNHPFEKWTQTDYYRMAAYFARVGRKELPGGRLVVFARPEGEVAHPRLGLPVAPAPFDGPPLAPDAPGDRREHLARWITAPRNPHFARSIVNRVWRHYMGRGLVEPVDDMRATNPASNEPLLQALTAHFVRSGFDLKRLMRTILVSRAYQRSSRALPGNAGDDRFYSRWLVKRVGAEVLLDAVAQVTGQPHKFGGIPQGVRAIGLPDTRIGSRFLDLFGRPARQVACECERSSEPSVAQALHLISAEDLNARLSAPRGALEQLLRSGATDREVLRHLHLSALGRPPTEREARAVLAALPGPGATAERRQVFSDLLWALITSPEFAFNH